MSIAVVLVAVAIPIYGNWQVPVQINKNTSLIIQALRAARTDSIARYNNAQHGVYFVINPSGADEFIAYQGASYALRNVVYDMRTSIDASLSLSASGFTMIGADVDINFSRGIGAPNNIGVFTLTHTVGNSRQITINSMGLVEEN